MKIFIAGGNFDNEIGKPSKIINTIFDAVSKNTKIEKCDYINGGNYHDLEKIIKSLQEYDAIFWMVNVDNDKEKIRNIKEIYPHKYLISSKRNMNEYSFQYLVNHALSLKSNLVIEFTKKDKIFYGRVFDPLGTVWCDYNSDFIQVVNKAIDRLIFISGITRQKTIYSGSAIEVPDETEFFTLIKSFAEIFHNIVLPEESVTRFLGNASFRCLRGFPSFRSGELIFVSRRNIDKRFIDKNGFVAVKKVDNNILYYGESKPSVDTPVQAALYELFPNVNYIIHSHVYTKNAKFTRTAIPCGGLEEIKEIINAVDGKFELTNFSLNLIGHGNIVFASDVSYFNTVEYVARSIPEIIES